MESSDAVVGFDRSAALGAFGITITFDPMMGHDLRRFLRLDVRADARGRRPLDASFVHRILANCHEKGKGKPNPFNTKAESQ